MSSIVNSIVGGVSGNAGGAGMNFQGQTAPIDRASTIAQANEQYGNVQTGLTQQQNFLNAVNAQNGLQNQTNTYNQLQGVADGTGLNPAQAMLNQQTQANVANQAAMMAGQRGSSSNPALIARQAAMQGGNLQQQAVGQGATMQANQSLQALNSMGSLATNQANQQANATNAYSNAAQAANAQVLGGIGGQNSAITGNMNNINSTGAQVSTGVAGQQGNIVGGVASALGKAAMMAEGGEVKPVATHNEWHQLFADGGVVATTPLLPTAGGSSQPTSRIGQYFNDASDAMNQTQDVNKTMNQAGQNIGGAMGKGLSSLMGGGSSPMSMAGGAGDAGTMSSMGSMMAARGGQVPALVSPGETYLDPKDVSKVAKGANPLEVGEKIPGKPKVKGNSYSNDTVSKTLESGGIVIPNSIMQSKDAKAKAAAFVAAVLKKNALKK